MNTQKNTRKILVYVCFAFMIFVSLFPIIFCLASSLRSHEDYATNILPFTIRSIFPSELTLENYKIIFQDYQFWKPILNSAIVTFFSIAFGCILNSIAAFAYTCFDFKGKKIFFALVMISFMIPFESIAIPLYSIVDQLKMIDTYRGMIIPAIADGLVIYLFIQFFKDLPVSLIESARMDGASWITVFSKIIIPISKPVFVTSALMMFQSQWNSYMWPLLVARSKDIRTIQIAISAFSGERNIQWTYIYAASFISILIPIILFIPLQKYYIEGITAGSVKG